MRELGRTERTGRHNDWRDWRKSYGWLVSASWKRSIVCNGPIGPWLGLTVISSVLVSCVDLTIADNFTCTIKPIQTHTYVLYPIRCVGRRSVRLLKWSVNDMTGALSLNTFKGNKFIFSFFPVSLLICMKTAVQTELVQTLFSITAQRV